MRLLLCTLGVLALLSGSASAYLSSDTLSVWIRGVGSEPDRDYDQLITDAPVDLDGVTLVVYPDSGPTCTDFPALENGTTYTLISTTGGLSGHLTQALGNVLLGDGDLYVGLRPMGRGCLHSLGDLQLHYHESGPVQTVTATVVDGSPIPVTCTSLAAQFRLPSRGTS